jgi:hypothetical protein
MLTKVWSIHLSFTKSQFTCDTLFFTQRNSSHFTEDPTGYKIFVSPEEIFLISVMLAHGF